MKRFYISFVFVSLLLSVKCIAQPAWTLDPFGKEKKPEQYEEKILGSEKTATKKFTIFRKFIQNNVTHYNFYFNANNKLNSVIERAKLAQKDNYSELLSFYPYSLDNTVSQQVELDSVIYKATGGILLHDLRNEWIDNLYLLIGKAYYFRRELDSAAMTFQFINYNLFPRKKNEEENRVVGGNAEAGTPFSIADKEKRNVVQKVLTKAPSRNESLIWLIRTFTEQKQYGQAAGLINILKEDPNLPKRLDDDLSEVEAYWFYSQERYDSAAVYLEKALTNAETKSDKARWEYLLGQLYEMSGKGSLASVYYKKSSKHTADPVMDIYARLNDAKLFKEEGNIKELKESIARLLKMAKRDRYVSYRDIIYYSTAKLSVQVPDTLSGITYYKNSIKYSTEDKGYKSRSFLQLADLAYNTRDYKNASYDYDSIIVDDIPKSEKPDYDIIERRDLLKKLVVELLIVEREDSLQMIAAMTPEKRDELINSLVKKYKKESGQKIEDDFKGNTIITFNNKDEQPDLFPATQKGEWYFYNSSMRTKGFNEFKSKWGKRANVDNWRTVSSSGAGVDNHGMVQSGITDSLKLIESAKFSNSYEGLLASIPLTPAQMDSSNDKIAQSLLAMANIFKFELLDYEQAINIYDIYLQRFPNSDDESEVYLGLYYSYNKLGNKERADYYKNLLTSKFSNSTAALKLTNPSSLDPTIKNPAATKKYLDIYDLFIEGKFEEALAQKKIADSSYGKNYWTPQLLYIEAIYYIKERDDSSAIRQLNNISVLYPNTPMQTKAITLIDVLNRRSEIENYLTNLDVKRAEEKTLGNIIDSSSTEKPKEIKLPSVKENNIDSAKLVPVIKDKVFTLESESPHVVLMVLNKVDGVYQQEAKNSFTRYNREMFFSAGIKINKEQLDNDRVILEFSPFINAEEAIKYLDKIKRAAPAEVSWLPPAKYSFIIISVENLQLLKENKDLERYRALLNTKYNNRF